MSASQRPGLRRAGNAAARPGRLARVRQSGADDLRARLLLDEVSDPIFTFSPAGEYLYVNHVFASGVRLRVDQIIGKTIWDIFPHDEADKRFATVRWVFEHREPRMVEVRVPLPDGDHYYITTAKPIFDRLGNVATVICISKDITERKRAELAGQRALAEAERLAQLRSDFLANMSHEIRTPLNGVLGLAQIGLREDATRDRAGELFARILESGQLLLSVVNDILDFSKIEAGKLAIEAVPLDPGRIVDQAVAMLAERAAARGVALLVEKAHDLPRACLGDPLRIEQVLLNLLSNAVKFTPHGTVRVIARRDDAHLAFEVIDTGIGMAPAQLGRLFTPFEQADGSTTRRFGGTGLGLAITRQLVELMRGEIRVDSREGEGSRFSVRVPFCECAAEVPSQAGAQRAAGGSRRLEGLQVLACEDNEVNQIVLEDMLAGEGAHVTMAGNGRLAVEAVERDAGRFDVAVMDVQMPEMDGLEATTLIRRRAPQLPVVGQTAHAMAEERERCLACGMREVVTKPIDLEALVAAILRHARPAAPVGERRQVGMPSCAVPGPARPVVLDHAKLAERYAARPAFIGKLYKTALDSLADRQERIRAAVASSDVSQLASLAHGLKGVAGGICAQEVLDCAVVLEAEARHATSDMPAAAGRVVSALDTLLGEIRAALAAAASPPQSPQVAGVTAK